MTPYMLRDDPLEQLPDAVLRTRLAGVPPEHVRLALELGRRQAVSRPVPTHARSPADLATLVPPAGEPIDRTGTITVFLGADGLVLGMADGGLDTALIDQAGVVSRWCCCDRTGRRSRRWRNWRTYGRRWARLGR